FELDHARGSSHGRTRIFRVAYPDPYWVRFAQQAYAGWQELDPSLLGLYGLVELVADPALTSASALDEYGVPHRLLDKDEVGAHAAGAEADTETEAPPDPAIVERIASWVRERFPEVAPDPVDAQSCLYTTTADEHFVLERRGRVVVGSACSGHGFKFAPAVGRRLADLALS